MKKIFFAMCTAAMFLMGMTGCSSDDSSSSVDTNALEQKLVGLWWDEFEYSDVTDEGVPFSRVLLAVEFEPEHTGCIYLAVFSAKGNIPLAVYGGPEEAGFNWRMLDDGSLMLSDSLTGESEVLTRSGNDGSGSYGDGMTDVSNTSMNYTDGSMTVTNDSYSGTLSKADTEKEAEIVKKLSTQLPTTNTNLEDADSIKINDAPADSSFLGR